MVATGYDKLGGLSPVTLARRDKHVNIIMALRLVDSSL